MQVQPSELVRGLSEQGGAAFEAFLYDLLTLEAQNEGLPPNAVVWDHRINVPDDGVDIRITQGVKNTNSLIPATPSIWSAKAGKDGIKATTFEKEISKHPVINQHLNEGNAFRYVVLQDCSQRERRALISKAKELCNDRTIDSSSIQIIFNEHLAQCVFRCPTLIPNHLPELQRYLGTGATAPDTWIGDQRHGATPFIQLDRSDTIEVRLRELLDGTGVSQYLHVAGWSGVGKSRLVAEILAETPRAEDAALPRNRAVVYPTWYDFEQGLLSALRSDQVKSALVIVDEVDMARVAELIKLCNRRPGLRLVSLGASEAQTRLPPECVFLERPSADDLEDIIRARAPNAVDSGTVRRIADLSDGDIRFAELLTDAAQDIDKNSESTGALIEALRDLDNIVNRYFEKHEDFIGDPVVFREKLATITLLAEVGANGDRKCELLHLADYCQKNLNDLRTANTKGERIGVCRPIGDFVECIPRPLATHIFERDAWPLIKDDLLDFFSSLPGERARRSFLRRVTYCSDLQREEVEEALGDMFRKQYAEADLKTLSDSELAHTLRSLIEVVPQEGLAWLRGIIESARVEELLVFPGSTGTFGPTYGRREIVWLCDHLRCFSDCFADAEAILYRLALAETERLANNATAMWQQCFWWRMSGTEVPFDERIDLLLDRLHGAEASTVELLLKGAIAALHEPMAALAPPEFVGGRMTPQEWRPRIWEDVFSQWDRVIAKIIDLSQNPSIHNTVIATIINNLELFVRLKIPTELKDIVLNPQQLDESQIQALREVLDRVLGRHSRLADEIKTEIEAWRNTLAPQSLSDKIRDVVGRDTWSHGHDSNDIDSWQHPYKALVCPIVEDPKVLLSIQDWLSSKAAKSSRALAIFLGSDLHAMEAIKDTVLAWLNAGECSEFVVGYFIGVSGTDRILPSWACEVLTVTAGRHPDVVVAITVEADNTKDGLERILKLLPSCSKPSELLYRLFGSHWETILTPTAKRRVLEQLVLVDDDEYAVSCALHLLTMWYHQRKGCIDEELDKSVGQLVHAVLGDEKPCRNYEWQDVMRWWAPRHPEEAANLLVRRMTTHSVKHMGLASEAEQILLELAPDYPDSVARAVEQALSDTQSRIAFHISVFRGLFEDIGLEQVQAIINRLGEDGASAIARHLPDPGTPEGADLLGWFLREYADNERVFSSYLCGRHSGKMVSGHAFDRRDEVYDSTEPFMNSKNPGEKKWAQWERKQIDLDAERDRKSVEERGLE